MTHPHRYLTLRVPGGSATTMRPLSSWDARVLRLYTPNGLVRRGWRAALQLAMSTTGGRSALERRMHDADPGAVEACMRARALATEIGIRFDRAVAWAPAPSQERKYSVLLITDGEPTYIVKLPDPSAANATPMLMRELRSLRDLAVLPELADWLPEHIEVPRGTQGPVLLSRVAQAAPLRPSGRIPAQIHRPLQILDDQQGTTCLHVPGVRSHGDLAPWNVLVNSRGATIIDWERYDIRPRGYDICYFHARRYAFASRIPARTAARLAMRSAVADLASILGMRLAAAHLALAEFSKHTLASDVDQNPRWRSICAQLPSTREHVEHHA